MIASHDISLETANDFILLSLPLSGKPSTAQELDTNTWLNEKLLGGRLLISNLNLPEFKIGSLDNLIIESDELNKIDNQSFQILKKIIELLKNYNINSNKILINNNQTINEYFESFNWNLKKFKLNKSINELIKLLSDEIIQLDNDIKNLNNSYSNVKQSLLSNERKKNGDLSIRSLHDLVKPEDFILNSDHLTTLLICVPKILQSDFEKNYEKLSDNVVPCSANILSKDDEFLLYNVHLFKKNVQDFTKNARDHKFIIRDFDYKEENINKLKDEHNQLSSQEHNLKLQLTRLLKTAFQDILMNWFHLKILRMFVESVLRYGLPPHFNTKILFVPSKGLKNCKNELINNFSYLAGNAFKKDKNGKILKEDANLGKYGGVVDQDYEAFVMYSISL